MAEEKKKTEEEEKDKKSDASESEKPEEKKSESSENSEEKKPEEKAPDESQADENGEGADEKTEDEKTDDKAEDESKAPETPELSEVDQLKAENLTLKTQLEAMKIGFTPDCMEDAVTLAEAIVKKDGVEIAAALQSVAKKYPDWKSDGKDNKNGKSKGGFKVGADSSESDKNASDRLSKAFGLKKK